MKKTIWIAFVSALSLLTASVGLAQDHKPEGRKAPKVGEVLKDKVDDIRKEVKQTTRAVKRKVKRKIRAIKSKQEQRKQEREEKKAER